MKHRLGFLLRTRLADCLNLIGCCRSRLRSGPSSGRTRRVPIGVGTYGTAAGAQIQRISHPRFRTNPAAPVLLGVIVFLAATGGGIYPWTVLLAGGLVTLTYLAVSRRRPRHTGIETAFLALLLFLLLTVLPLPLPLTRLTGGLRYAQNLRAADALRRAADAGAGLPEAGWFAMTRNRAGSLRVIALLAGAVLTGLLAGTLAPRHRRGLLRCLWLFGAILAAAGYVALRVRPQGNTLWWTVPVPAGLPGPLVCFVNRNHYAGYLAMLVPLALATGVADLSRRRILFGLAGLAAAAGMAAVVGLTHSRGAAVGLAGGLAALFLVYIVRRRFVPAVLLLALGAALAAAALHAGGDTLAARLRTLRAPLANGHFDERIDAWRTCLRIWRAYPAAGCGANAFRMVYPLHRHSSRREYMVFAENEYAQLLAEGGLAGVALAAALAAAWLRAARRGGRAAHPRLDDAMAPTAAAAGLTVAAVHAAFDFAPHVPLYGFTAAALAGAALGPAEDGTGSRLDRTARGLAPAGLAAALVLLLLAPLARRMRTLDSPGAIAGLEGRTAAAALTWVPTSWQAWYRLGQLCDRAGGPADRVARQAYTVAGELDPNNYKLWLAIGKLRLRHGDRAGAREAFARVKKLRYWVTVPEVPIGDG